MKVSITRLILILLFSGFAFSASSQIVVPRSPWQVAPTDGNLYTTWEFKLPRYVDTAHANTYIRNDSLALEMYVPGLGVYIRDTVAGYAAHKWTLIAGSGGAVSSVFGRTGAVVATAADYTSFYPLLSGSYSNPSWINTLAASKISSPGSLTAGSSKITFPSGTPSTALLDPVTIDVVEANFNLANLGGLLGIAQINASGVPSSTTFLRGDGTWASASGGTTYTADETSIHLASTVFGIKSTWVGQTSLTTLGTITTGTWNGTAIANAYLANSSVSYNGVSVALGSTGNITDANLVTSNVTTNNVSTSKHGFAPILPNDATKYLDGTGVYSVPAGSGGGIGVDAVQTYTTGTTLTQTTGDNIIQVNPSSTQSTLAITSATTSNWHNSNDLWVVVGGTIATGTVITTFSFAVGSGLTLIDDIPPTTLMAGHPLHYHKISTIVYRLKD